MAGEPTQDTLEARNISPGRVTVVIALAATMICGSAASMIHSFEYWPFSHFPMYSRPRTTLNRNELAIYGLPRHPKLKPFRLKGQFEMAIWELSWAHRGKRGSEDWKRAMRAGKELARWYERERAAGEVQGPRIKGVRLLMRRWSDAQTRPADQPQWKVLMEVELSDKVQTKKQNKRKAKQSSMTPATNRAGGRAARRGGPDPTTRLSPTPG